MSTTTTKDVIEYREDELAFIKPAEDNVSEPFNTHSSAIFLLCELFLLFLSPYTPNYRKCPNGSWSQCPDGGSRLLDTQQSVESPASPTTQPEENPPWRRPSCCGSPIQNQMQLWHCDHNPAPSCPTPVQEGGQLQEGWDSTSTVRQNSLVWSLPRYLICCSPWGTSIVQRHTRWPWFHNSTLNCGVIRDCLHHSLLVVKFDPLKITGTKTMTNGFSCPKSVSKEDFLMLFQTWFCLPHLYN